MRARLILASDRVSRGEREDRTEAGVREALLAAVAASRARLLLVSNEVGSGVVPMGALSRTFVDEAGRLHQRLAATCARVTLVVAGLPTTLKDDCP